jgi:RNase P subunit RPR2
MMRDRVDHWCKKCYKMTEHKFTARTATYTVRDGGMIGQQSVSLTCMECGRTTRFREIEE